MVLSDEEGVKCGEMACVRHLRGKGKNETEDFGEEGVCDKHAFILRRKYDGHYVIIYK